jgi:Protein of unknown function (DUF2804)
MPPLTDEPELTQPADQCLPDGSLDPAARGWSRRPLLRCNLRGPWGRVKRWEYWCVTGADRAVSFVYADVDYLGLAGVWCCDLRSGFVAEQNVIAPASRGIALGERVDEGAYRLEHRKLDLEIVEEPKRTVLRAAFRDRRHGPVTVDLEVERPAGHESLNVLIPWSARRFQFTSKQNTRPARGLVGIGGHRWSFGAEEDAFGTLDHGRGIWPYTTRWNWGSASGTLAGRRVGIQLGGKWTAGTGFTENALCVDGRITKLGEELAWTYDWARPLTPWRVVAPQTGAVDLTLHPFHDKHSATKLLVLSTEVHQVFGHWVGTVRTDEGEAIPVQGLLGWAEESRSRW